MTTAAPSRIFLLSPASCSGQRAQMVLNDRGRFGLALALRAPEGAPLGQVFSFVSGLYFRGKLEYARAYTRPPEGVPGVLVLTPGDGLQRPDTRVRIEVLERWAGIPIDAGKARYTRPLLRDAQALAAVLDAECQVVLLGSVATGKYVDPLQQAVGTRLHFPADFVGRGDMSRGGLLLRGARAA